MENGFRSRKRYCCFYCNTYFNQVDAWQRHNRKHTGVEIECDDCGEMFSDHIDLKSHQPNCQAHHAYSEDVYTDNLQKVVHKEHETPDSTSKQDVNNLEEGENVSPAEANNVISDNNETTEYDDLIGEVAEAKDSNSTNDEVDPDTEAMIGIDHSAGLPVDDNNNEERKSTDNSLTENVVNTDEPNSQSNASSKEMIQLGTNTNSFPHMDSQINGQVSPSTLNAENLNSLNMHSDSGDINKKYQPYFCKNCGARFTRKDSVTRHLKKGTCSGKSAIVCNICGKIFPDVIELQRHFKLEHKNIAFTPPIVARPILPRQSETHDNQRYPTYPFLAENTSNSRPFINNHDQRYHQMPPGLPAMFYTNQNHRYRSNRDHYFPSKHMKVRPPVNGPCKKEGVFMDLHRKSNMTHFKDEVRPPLKRDYDFHENDDRYYRKALKIDLEHNSQCHRFEDSHYTKNINLSEYTNNAMSSKQYYDNRFSSKGHAHRTQMPPVNITKEETHAHRCKVCGLEFPRFEYLLTHLRKHKDIDRSAECEEIKLRPKEAIITSCNQSLNVNHSSFNFHNDQHNNQATVNDSNSSSSTDEPDQKQQINNVAPITPPQECAPAPVTSGGQDNQNLAVSSSISNETTNGAEMYTSHQEQLNMLTQQQVKPHPEGYTNAIGNAFDGKFRPFICENCGQRFTRKDSLVRHAKKQTCYEEIVDLKCKHCDKSFRYNKCLTQHQELVHGIPPPVNEDKNTASEDEDSMSDKSEPANLNVQKPSAFQMENNLETNVNKSDQPRHVYHDPPRQNRVTYNNEDVNAHQDNYYPPHHTLHHQPLKPNQNTFIQLNRPNQQTHPKFISPKEYKIEKNRPTDGTNSQDSPYIGYSMLQPRPFQCEYCGDRFAHRHSLKRHVRRHLGIGIPCHDCGKLYRDQSEWRRHQLNIHNRRYEKYEVPSRMSFRDGLDQGLIGVLPSKNGTLQHPQDETDSDRSEEDHMANGGLSKAQPFKFSPNSSRVSANINHHPKNVNGNDDREVKKDDEKMDEKDHKLKLFDFKSQGHDKDSRKSVLDSYLCSMEEEVAEASVKTHI